MQELNWGLEWCRGRRGRKAVSAERSAAESFVALKLGEKSRSGISMEEWPFPLIFPKLPHLGSTLLSYRVSKC